MPCAPFNLRTDGLSGASTGGTWSFVSGSYSGPALSGDNPAIDIASHIGLGLTATFRYTGLDCDSNPVTADVTLLNMDLGTATSFAETLCSNEAAVVIFTQLTGTLGPHGAITWSGDIANGGFSGSGATAEFDPSASGTGVFTFTATINPSVPGGYSDLACCDPVVATYTVTVEDSFNPGTGGTYAGC